MMTKYFSIDCISKVLFAIDVDSYKERNTVFVKSVARLGELNFVEQALCILLPRSVAEYFSLQPFNLRPVNSLGKYFSRIIEERKKAGVKYNDLLEALQNAVDNDKVKMTTDVVIGRVSNSRTLLKLLEIRFLKGFDLKTQFFLFRKLSAEFLRRRRGRFELDRKLVLLSLGVSRDTGKAARRGNEKVQQ